MFYNTKSSIGLFFLNNRVDTISIYNEIHYYKTNTWLSKEKSLIVYEKNNKLLESIVPSDVKPFIHHSYKFKWGTLSSYYDSKGGFSSIAIKYGS